MAIALDFDGVVADLHTAMVEHTACTDDDFEQWGKDDFEHFMDEAARVWRDHHNDIYTVDYYGHVYARTLDTLYDVDLVTNTVATDDVVGQWLHQNDYPNFDVVRAGADQRKSDLDYGVYIDDNPNMAGEVNCLYLRDRQWNQDVRGDGEYMYHSYEPSYIESEGLPSGHLDSETPHVIRVTALSDVLFDLSRVRDHRKI